jgi:hypothetical protein
VNEKPILFSAEMVRAILDGRKSQTRRVVKPQKGGVIAGAAAEPYHAIEVFGGGQWHIASRMECRPCPYGIPGNQLWVKETHYKYGKWIKDGFTAKGKQRWRFRALTTECRYFDYPPPGVKPNSFRKGAWYKRPSIFMRRADSRITLEITAIRVQRVQDISEMDCYAEGRSLNDETDPVSRPGAAWFRELWDKINAKRGYPWESNPWVWAVSFRRINAGEGKE